MGKTFGNLARITGVTFFRLSPYEQKAFGGLIKDGFPNTVRRCRENVLYVSPFFLAIGVLMNWADEVSHQMDRKNPADYENDT